MNSGVAALYLARWCSSSVAEKEGRATCACRSIGGAERALVAQHGGRGTGRATRPRRTWRARGRGRAVRKGARRTRITSCAGSIGCSAHSACRAACSPLCCHRAWCTTDGDGGIQGTVRTIRTQDATGAVCAAECARNTRHGICCVVFATVSSGATLTRRGLRRRHIL